MPHYKSPDNTVHFIDSEAFAHLLPAGSVPITDAEALALRPAVNHRPMVTEEFKAKREVTLGRIVQIAVVLDMTGGDQAFRNALLWLREQVIPLDSHELVLAAPDGDLQKLREAYVQAYRAICARALRPIPDGGQFAPDLQTAAAWKVELDKVFK